MRMNRNVWATIAATIAVVVVVILGFRVLGGPGSQRLVQSDIRRVRALASLAQQINYRSETEGKILPANLEKFPNSIKQDPVTAKPFGYRPKSNSEYELCATFAADNRDLQTANPDEHWTHPKGDYCFEFDTTQQVPFVPNYY
jgi:hypothetical protein